MQVIENLQNPEYVAKVQRFFGIYAIEENGLENDHSMYESYTTVYSSYFQKDSTVHYDESYSNENGDIKESKNGVNCVDKNKRINHSQSDAQENVKQKSIRYTIKYPLLHYFFKTASILGDEPFYLLFYPLFGWNADFYVTRLTAVLWAIVMYIGQASKDVIKWHRPGYPPVIPLEVQHEYGMPSTHAMAGTAMPFTLMYIISSRYEVPISLLLIVAILWSSLVISSRLYLGVHTVGDVTVGAILSVIIMLVTLPKLDAFDKFCQTYPLAPVILLVIAVLLSTKVYPKGANSAQDDAVIIVAVIYGLTFGAWLNHNLGIVSIPNITSKYQVPMPTSNWLLLSLLRLLIGIALVGLSKVLLSMLVRPLTERLYAYVNKEADSHLIKVTYRFITYACLGVLIIHLIPILFHVLHIDRDGFYIEG